MLFFIFVGLTRGFIKECTSLISWIVSGILAVVLRPYISDFVSSRVSNQILCNIISSIFVFLIAIVGISILLSNIASAINTRFPTSINITLGFAFGFAKGFLICSLIFASIITLFGNTEEMSSKSGPKWLQNSQTYRPLSFGAYVILPFANSMLGQIKNKYTSPSTEDDKKDNNKENDINSLIDRTENSETKDDNGGYKKDQVDKLKHLIDVI